MIKPSPLQVRSAVAALVLSASTLIAIATHEGYREEAYMPTKYDVPTIGFGQTKDVKMGDKTDPVRSLRRLQKELDEVYVAAVKRHIKVPLTDGEFGALVSWTYNFGEGNLIESTMLKKFNAGDYVGACAELSKWDKQWTGKRDVNGKKIMIVLPGLTARRTEERKICEGRA